MNLKETKEHILRVSEGTPNPMQQAALIVIEEKLKEEAISKFAINNKHELIKLIEFNSMVGGISRYLEDLEILKKHAKSVINKRNGKENYSSSLTKLLIKINKL